MHAIRPHMGLLPRRWRNPFVRNGIALVDTIMAMVVLGVALPPLIVLLYQGVVESRRPEARVVATNLVRDRIEELIATRHVPLPINTLQARCVLSMILNR